MSVSFLYQANVEGWVVRAMHYLCQLINFRSVGRAGTTIDSIVELEERDDAMSG